MTRKRSVSAVWVIVAALGFVFLLSHLQTFDVGTMNNPHVLSLQK